MSNVDFSKLILEKLWAQGVRECCVAAGSRNSPMLYALSQAPQFKTWSFYDEREAAFFALGRIQQLQKPVAVLTTSGTATAELLPAIIEAHYSGLPLIALTADRPARYRGTGAPQAIEQKNLYANYVEAFWEGGAESKEGETELEGFFKRASFLKPLHLNLFFEEPLIDKELPLVNLAILQSDKHPSVIPFSVQSAASRLPQALRKSEAIEVIGQMLEKSQRPLVLLGPLAIAARPAAKDFCLRLKAPVYAEALSGLREDAELGALKIQSSERLLKVQVPDLVIRIGGVPTCRFWRDLEFMSQTTKVLSLDEKQFAGMCGSTHFQGPLPELLGGLQERLGGLPVAEKSGWGAELLSLDKKFADEKLKLFAEFPQSEPALFAHLSRHIAPGSNLFLGNSLSIREWDLAAQIREKNFRYFANRGANGIDGELSTFLGVAQKERPNAAILGDLTTLYSLSAPWIVPQMEEMRLLIYVINNGGAKIFSRLPPARVFAPEARNKLLELHHSVHFKAWAELWNLGYELWDGSIPAGGPSCERSVIELVPNAAQSEGFWAAFDRLWV